MTTRSFDHHGLRKKRVSKGLTQTELGDLLGVTVAAVSYWERGDTTPSTLFLPPLAAVLDCRIDDLFGPAVGAHG